MGRIAQLLSFARRTLSSGEILDEAKVDAGGGDVHTVQHYADPGDDSQPLPDDQAVLVETGGAGESAATGWHDAKTPRKAQAGEKRSYSRNAAGTAAAEVYLKANGEIRIEVFTSATIYLKTGGTVVIDSPDVRIGDENASQPVARVGDLVVGAVNALSTAPGNPILPVTGSPTASGGVPFAGQIVSGANRAKAT